MPEGDVTIQPEFVKDSKYAGDVTIMGTPEKEPEGEFAISVSDKVENGTVTVDNMAKAGSLVTITAEPAEGYRFMQASVICENNEAVIVESKDGKAQFIMPECPVTIMAWYVPLHSITALAYPAVTDHLVGIRQCQTDKICRHLITQTADRFLKSGK